MAVWVVAEVEQGGILVKQWVPASGLRVVEQFGDVKVWADVPVKVVTEDSQTHEKSWETET